MIKILICTFCIFVVFNTINVIPVYASPLETPKVVLLETTNEKKDGYFVLKETTQYQDILYTLNHSFARNSLILYSQALKYANLANEPLYLSIRQGSGKSGQIGFYLKKDSQLINKTTTPWIEMSTEDTNKNQAYMSSFTQIFPHEMGHILLHLTAPDFSSEQEISTLEIHNSDVITDYAIAFHEGFAEHFEILSRQMEENQNLKEEIEKDMHAKRFKVNIKVSSLKRDFTFPLRFDFYRATSLFILQSREALKRNDLPLSGDCIYKNEAISFSNNEKAILFNNLGFTADKKQKKNLQQNLSTESVISRFFILMQKESKLSLSDHYNKIFEAFHQYLGKDNKPPLIQFVNGYCSLYPKERSRVLKAFKDATGYQFVENAAPEIWIISNTKHGLGFIDQFGANQFPVYTVNINTCEVENLLKLEGIDRDQAENIIQYREEHGFFKDSDDFIDIPGLDRKTQEDLKNNVYGIGWSKSEADKIMNSIKGVYQNERNMLVNILKSTLIHLEIRFVIWFALYFLLYAALILRKRDHQFKKSILQFLKFLLFALLGVISATISSHPILFFLTPVIIMEMVKLITVRKDRNRLFDNLVTSGIMTCIIVYSLI